MKNIYTLALLLTVFFAGFTSKVKAQNTITCDSVIQTSTCAGGNIIIPFSVTGNFPFGNVFTAQMSDWLGSFAAPASLGTSMFTIGGNGIIFGTIPANTNFGFLYRVRIVSSNPQDTSNTSPNTVIVTQIAQLNTIIANPGDSACPGDTISLFAANIANAYSWNTGDTTQSIQVTSSGIYSVTTTDALTCQSTTSDTVVFDISACTGIAEDHLLKQIALFPDPADDAFTLQLRDIYDADAVLSIYNSTGQKVSVTKFRAHPSSSEQFNIASLSSGIYMVILESDGQRATQKLIVQ